MYLGVEQWKEGAFDPHHRNLPFQRLNVEGTGGGITGINVPT
jgi:hypothetical protein